MEGQSGLSELSVISWVSAIQGCPLSGVPLYSHSVTLHRAKQGQPARRARHADAAAAGGGVVSFQTAVSWAQNCRGPNKKSKNEQTRLKYAEIQEPSDLVSKLQLQ